MVVYTGEEGELDAYPLRMEDESARARLRGRGQCVSVACFTQRHVNRGKPRSIGVCAARTYRRNPVVH